MTSYKSVIGMDPSLSGFGVCCMDFDDKEVRVKSLLTISSKPGPHQYARISRYRGILALLRNHIPAGSFCVIEGYSFLARGSAATALPELGALVRNMLQDMMVNWVEMSPSSVKKYGTGTGAAKKELMLMHVQQKYGHMLVGSGLEFHDSNQCDAFVMALMGAHYAQWKQFGVKPTKEHLEIFKHQDAQRFEQLGF